MHAEAKGARHRCSVELRERTAEGRGRGGRDHQGEKRSGGKREGSRTIRDGKIWTTVHSVVLI